MADGIVVRPIYHMPPNLLDPNRLDVHELADPVLGKFASVAGALHATEWQARIRSHHFVQEDHPGIKFVYEPFRFHRIIGPGTGTQTESAIVGDLDSLIHILRTKK